MNKVNNNAKKPWIMNTVAASACASLMMPSAFAETATDAEAMLREFNLYYDVALNGDDHSKYAHELQRRLHLNVPLKYANILASHNTYNSDAYSDIVVQSEQEISVSNQIDEGAELIELDLHQFSGVQYFCHNTWCGNDGGWSSIKTGKILVELAAWVNAQNTQGTTRTVIVHVENAASENSATTLMNNIKAFIGLNNIYTPDDYLQDFPMGREYKSGDLPSIKLPTAELTRQHMLDNNKRLIFIITRTAPDDGHEANALFFEGFNGLGREHDEPETSRSYWEDGKNVVEHYDIEKGDQRFALGSLWSWEDGEPNNTSGLQDCAAIKSSNGRWVDDNCGQSNPYPYACKKRVLPARYVNADLSDEEAIGSLWRITSTGGRWSDGEAACQEEFGNRWFFDVPRNAVENAELKNILRDENVDKAWLNYHDNDDEGVFEIPTETVETNYAHSAHAVYFTLEPSANAQMRVKYTTNNNTLCTGGYSSLAYGIDNLWENPLNFPLATMYPGDTYQLVNINNGCLNVLEDSSVSADRYATEGGWNWRIQLYLTPTGYVAIDLKADIAGRLTFSTNSTGDYVVEPGKTKKFTYYNRTFEITAGDFANSSSGAIFSVY